MLVAEQRDIHDPDLGGRYTVKVYSSTKVETDNGEWRHARIELRPDSTDAAFQPVTVDAEHAAGAFKIVAELTAVLDGVTAELQ